MAETIAGKAYVNTGVDVINQRIHVVAVPAILWSVVALLWCLPPLITWFQYGIWSAFALVVLLLATLVVAWASRTHGFPAARRP